MAHTFTTLNTWEDWGASSPSGDIFFVSYVRGQQSSATGFWYDFGANFNFSLASVNFLIESGTFQGGETITVDGGGNFLLGPSATAVATHTALIMTGVDSTTNLGTTLLANTQSSIYVTCTGAQLSVTATLFIGSPAQSSATYAISQNEAIHFAGNLFVAGRNTAASTHFKAGTGTIGSIHKYTSENGSTFRFGDSAPSKYLGSSRFGRLEAHASNFNGFNGWFRAELQRCNIGSEEMSGLGAVDLKLFSTWGYDSDDVLKMIDCNIAAGMGLSHVQVEFDDVNMGGGSYGIIRVNNVDLTATNLTIQTAGSHIFGFIAGGQMNLQDSDVNMNNVSGFWSAYTVSSDFSFNVNFITAEGNAISGVRTRAWNTTQDSLNDAPLFNVTSGAGGSIASQVIAVQINGEPQTNTLLNPITFKFDKVGWAYQQLTQTITAATTWTIQMQPINISSKVE